MFPLESPYRACCALDHVCQICLPLIFSVLSYKSKLWCLYSIFIVAHVYLYCGQNRIPWKFMGKTLEHCRPFLNHLGAKFMEKMGLKALGNYSASIRSNNFSILSCEGPKPIMFMISGFLDPVGTLISGFGNTRILLKT